jgi:hypothetical protein
VQGAGSDGSSRTRRPRRGRAATNTSPSAASGWSVTEAVPADKLVKVGAEWDGDASVQTEVRTLVDGEWGDRLELGPPERVDRTRARRRPNAPNR